jgi:iron complex outermembrane receptor protein
MFKSRTEPGKAFRVVVALATSITSFAVSAQIEEVIVTAQKIEELAQEVPVSVTAFSAEELSRRSVFDVADLEQFTPGLYSTGGGTGGSGQQGNYFIRGVGQGEFTAAQDPGVATYVDGVYIGRTGGANFRLLDIERVEVLRGPQGTLFGRNAVGGAISVITADPTGEVGGKALVRGGSRDRIDGELLLDFPLVENVLNGKLSVLWHNQDGYTKSVIDNRTFGDVDMKAARLKLHWLLSDTFDAMFNFDVSDSSGTTNGAFLFNANEKNGRYFGGLLNIAFPNEFAMARIGAPPGTGISSEISADPRLSYQSIDPIDDVEIWGASATLTWDFDAYQIKSITAYRELDQSVANDYDASRFTYYDQLLSTIQDQFSQELQISGLAHDSRLQWLGGLFYYTETADQNNAITQGAPPVRFSPGGVVSNQAFTSGTDSYAAFAQLTFDLTQQWAVTGGVRYSHEEKDFVYHAVRDNTAGTSVFVTGGVLPPGVAAPAASLFGDVLPVTAGAGGFPFAPGSSCSTALISLIPNLPFGPFRCVAPGLVMIPIPDVSDSWNAWTGRAAIEYKSSDEVLLYASWSRGFKSGGSNPRPLTAADAVPFDPETVDQFEIGIKSDWFDNRLRANFAGYYSDYQDLQALVVPIVPPGAPPRFFVTTNVGDADLYGIEAELLAAPTDALLLNLAVTWAETEISSLTPEAQSGTALQVGNELAGRPDLLISAGAQYTWPVGGQGDFTLRADYYYHGKSYFNAENTVTEDAYELVNLRATFRTADGRWAFSGYGRNIFDELYLTGRQDVVNQLGTDFGWYGEPEEWGIEASYFF